MTAVNTLEITVLFEDVMVTFVWALARAGFPPESCSCTAKRASGCSVPGVNMSVLAFGAVAKTEEGAGTTVDSLTEELAYPVVNEDPSSVKDTSAVTFAVPCRIPAVTFTTANVSPLGITTLATPTMALCDEERLTGMSEAAIAGEPNASSSESSRAGCDAPSAGRGVEIALTTTCEGTGP
jgi:hypothetical protein